MIQISKEVVIDNFVIDEKIEYEEEYTINFKKYMELFKVKDTSWNENNKRQYCNISMIHK